ncbi:MAG: cytochrome C oxidase subunit IV family protein [Rhizobiaceae bacterium]
MGAATKAWIAMMALTAGTMAAMQAGLPDAASRAWIVLLALVTIVKGRLILLDFLELSAASRWRTGIVAAFVAIIALVSAGLMLG